MSFTNAVTVSSSTGASLSVRWVTPKNASRAIVHINHGLAEHSIRYAHFAESLTKDGFAVVAHDHRGHGFTIAPNAPHGVFSLAGDGVDLVMEDCGAVQKFALEEVGSVPVIMFGHSMGGLITMNYALRYPQELAGAAVWNANFSGGILGRLGQMLLAFERFRLGSDVPSRIMPKLTFADWAKKIPARRTEFDWLSHIEAQVDAYIADPACGWDASVSLWQDIFKMVFAGGALNNLKKDVRDLPFMLVGGGQDPATFNGKAVMQKADALKKAGVTSVNHHHFETARHETLNDLDADRATNAFKEWMSIHL
ncbi:MAG: alpha/beta hydrolase [Pseudomonadota bacterium]